MTPELRAALEGAQSAGRDQDTFHDGVVYRHTFNPMGRVCPMHYRCSMTVERVKEPAERNQP